MSPKLVSVVVAAFLAWIASDFALGEEMPGKCERSYLLPRPYETNATEDSLNDIILEAKCLFNCINVRVSGLQCGFKNSTFIVFQVLIRPRVVFNVASKVIDVL